MAKLSFLSGCGYLVASVLLIGPATAWGEQREPRLCLSNFDAVVEPLLEKMTLAEKVGQMTQAEYGSLKGVDEIRELAVGSVLSGGNDDPAAGNSVDAWTALYDKCQGEALKTRLGVPLLYGIDAVHGHSNVLDAVIFPHNIGLGCADEPDLVERIARLTALEVRATGIQWAFAPCVTVPRDDRWGRTYEGFSEDPERVSRLGAAAVRGLQTDDLSAPEAVLACAKHFVGDGGTVAEVRQSQFLEGVGIRLDQGDTRCDEETLRRVHISPYLPCLAEGVASIMPSYSSWNGVKCTASKELLTDILKEELGFQGFLISDYQAIDQCHEDYKTAIGIAINAGIDMAMAPHKYREYIKLLTELVNEGVVPQERIDDAVRRILRVKAAMGLLDPDRNQLSDAAWQAGFGSEERRQVAREAVQKSLVLLKNENALPLKPGSLQVVGAAADDLGIQCGGWTIDWQGKVGEVTSGGTTILEGFRQLAGEDAVSYSADGSGLKADAPAIVVVGEKPYAEGVGDNDQLTLSEEDQAVVKRSLESGAPVVLVVLSGRPIVLEEATLGAAQAVVAAWLPGTEGAGVADVLLGHAAPTGTLSFSWPRSADQHPINVGDEDYDPLFPYGHGLKYEPSQISRHETPEAVTR